MKMNMKLVLLFSLCLFGLQAGAEESVVIDTQSVGEPPAAIKPGANSATSSDAQAEANAANKEQFLKSGRMSPRQKAALERGELADSNKGAGDAFLASNGAKPGVISLPSGLQYKILRAGNGIKPKESSMIRCRYKGTLTDGSIIDKSAENNKPSTIQVAGLLAGLKQAALLMPTGSKWQIVIPPQLAYGASGYHDVGPNAVVVYEMEILGIK
jgi:FKBP-type peptidyl-prolyl cis-trans isomerase FklB